MSTAIPMNGAGEMSPRTKARIAGAFYLATILMGMFAQGFIQDRLVIAGDAGATAANILAHEPLYRLGFTVFLVELTCQIVMTAFLYDLLNPVNRSLSSLAAVISYVGIGIKTMSRLFYFAPLLVLANPKYLAVFSGEQREALALLLIKVNDYGAAMAMVFFGVYAMLKGYLIIRSTFLPRWLGILLVVSGLGWMTYLWPPIGFRYFPIVAAVALGGSLASIAWFLVVGVNEARWREQQAATANSIWR